MVRDSINIAGNSYSRLLRIDGAARQMALHCHVDWHMMKGLGIIFEVPEMTSDGAKLATTLALSFPTKEPSPTAIVQPMGSSPKQVQGNCRLHPNYVCS